MHTVYSVMYRKMQYWKCKCRHVANIWGQPHVSHNLGANPTLPISSLTTSFFSSPLFSYSFFPCSDMKWPTGPARRSGNAVIFRSGVRVTYAPVAKAFLQRAEKLALQSLYILRQICPSGTLQYCVKTKERRAMRSSPSGSPVYLIFWCQKWLIETTFTGKIWVQRSRPPVKQPSCAYFASQLRNRNR